MTIQRLIYNVSKNSGDVANNLDLVDSLHNVTKLEHTMRVETFRKIVEDLKHIKKEQAFLKILIQNLVNKYMLLIYLLL